MRRERPCTAPGCAGNVRDTGVICDGCATRLERALGDVGALTEKGRHLAVELLTTLARQGRTGTGARGGTPDWTDEDRAWPQSAAATPLPFDPAATEAAWVLGNTLSTWARVLIDAGAQPWPTSGAQPVVAAWLLGHLEQIRRHEAAGELVDEVVAAVRLVERAVDRVPGRWYAGPCECGAELYARPAAPTVACGDCDARYDAAERRQWLLDEAEDTLAHAELIAGAITTLGEPVTAAMIRGYAHRGRILPRSVDTDGRPLYRVGDVLDVARDMLRAKAERHTVERRTTRKTTACA